MGFIYLLAIVVMVMVIASDIWPKGWAGVSIAKMCLQFLKYGSLAWLFCLVTLFKSDVLLAILLLAIGRDLFKKYRAGEKIRYEVMRFVGWGWPGYRHYRSVNCMATVITRQLTQSVSS